MPASSVAGTVLATLLLLTSSCEVLSTDSDLYKRVFTTLVDKFVDELPPVNASAECLSAMASLAFDGNNITRLKYIDALGKPGAGLGMGNMAWWGSYSECKTIPDAHYCLANVVVIEPIKQNKSSSKHLAVNWGVCVPDACSADAVIYLLNALFEAVNKENKAVQFSLGTSPGAVDPLGDNNGQPVACAEASKYTAGVIATLVLCGVILFLCCVGTAWDIALDCFQPQATESDGKPQSVLADGGANRVKEADTEMLIPPASAENCLEKFFLCFSLIRNTSRIMDTKVPPGAITSINGMRVLSMFWVILGHTYIWSLIWGGNLSNIISLQAVLHRFTFQGIAGGDFSVDSFFFLSGLLSMYLSIRVMAKRNGKLPLFQFYFHRFWRLTPTYMFVLLFYDKLLGFLAEGPMWFTQQGNPACDKYWWTNLLYINNFYPTDGVLPCMGWSWYLANDMQFYVISPVVLYCAYRFGVLGLLASAGPLLLGCFISTAVIIAHYNVDASIGLGVAAPGETEQMENRQTLVYVKPYCRIAPYIVGLGLGYLFHNKKIMSRRMPKHVALIGWCVAIVLGMSTVYGQYGIFREGGAPFTRVENVMYGTFSRFAWGIAIAWVIYVCHKGIGGLVNKFLSASFWIPLSRLTYTAYLVHPLVLFVNFSSYETISAYSDVHIVFHFTGSLVVSYMAAFVVSVCVEYPMMQLEKMIFKTNR